mgnify:CR=1 FL=1
MNVSDLNQPLMEPLGIPRLTSNNQISYQAARYRSVASQPSSNSHLEKLLKVFSLVEKIKASFIFSPAFQIPFFKSFICGEYRSRTDDLLRARQAL